MPAISSTPPSPSLTRLAQPLPGRTDAGRARVVADVQNTQPDIKAAKPVAQRAAASPEASQAPAKAPVNALSKEEVARQVQALQAKMDKLNPALAFVVDEDSGRALIQLTDRTTKEVILQFPSEAALQISKALDQFQKGQLINRTV
jgi:flagellar protein FlaG